jgi:hypothetical protein
VGKPIPNPYTLAILDFHPVSYNTAIHPSLAKDLVSYNCKRSLPFTNHKAGNEDYHLLGCNTVKAGTNLPTFGGTLI